MNDMTVRESANVVVTAFLSGDLTSAFNNFTDEAKEQFEPYIPSLPSPVEAGQVTSVLPDGPSFVARLDISGGGRELSLETTWEEREGRPMIVGVAPRT